MTNMNSASVPFKVLHLLSHYLKPLIHFINPQPRYLLNSCYVKWTIKSGHLRNGSAETLVWDFSYPSTRHSLLLKNWRIMEIPSIYCLDYWTQFKPQKMNVSSKGRRAGQAPLLTVPRYAFFRTWSKSWEAKQGRAWASGKPLALALQTLPESNLSQ